MPALQHDIAGALLEFAAQYFHEGRLATAVRADQPIAVAVGEFDRDLFKQRLRAKLNGDVGSRKHLIPMMTKNAAFGRAHMSSKISARGISRRSRVARLTRKQRVRCTGYRGLRRRFKEAPSPAADSSRAQPEMLASSGACQLRGLIPLWQSRDP